MRTTPWSIPFLRWAGSKKKLLPILLRNAPKSFEAYVEPFCGSAVLFFALRPKKAILNDNNAELIHSFFILRQNPRKLSRLLRTYPEGREYYYSLRRRNPMSLSPLERAARFIFLNRHCFNGVYRTNKEGSFNVPKGYNTGRIPQESTLYRCSVALRNASLSSTDFFKLLPQIKKNDFVYIDPPYLERGREFYGEYGTDSFAHADKDRLSSFMHSLDKRDAVFIMSYMHLRNTGFSLASEWHTREVLTRRSVACCQSGRGIATELLISNRELR